MDILTLSENEYVSILNYRLDTIFNECSDFMNMVETDILTEGIDIKGIISNIVEKIKHFFLKVIPQFFENIKKKIVLLQNKPTKLTTKIIVPTPKYMQQISENADKMYNLANTIINNKDDIKPSYIDDLHIMNNKAKRFYESVADKDTGYVEVFTIPKDHDCKKVIENISTLEKEANKMKSSFSKATGKLSHVTLKEDDSDNFKKAIGYIQSIINYTISCFMLAINFCRKNIDNIYKAIIGKEEKED